jgi:hypothetical protein
MNVNNIKQERQPPLRIQFESGYYAFSKGWLDNRYHPDSMAGKEWLRGFNQAYFDNLVRMQYSKQVKQ